MIVAFLTFISSIVLVLNSDCSQDPTKPQSNCFMFCISNYPINPQRRYYNVSTQNCQKMYGCPNDISKPYYYDYSTNRCYETPEMLKIVESPEQMSDYNYDTADNANSQFVCVNGNTVMKPLYGLKCECLLLWTNSGRLAQPNVPYMCDKVEKRLDIIFNKLTIQNGQVVKYDNLLAQDVQKLLANALETQANQSFTSQINNTFFIQFDFNQLPPGEIISQREIYWLYILIAILVILLIITTYQWWKNRKNYAPNNIFPYYQHPPPQMYPPYPVFPINNTV